MEKHICIDCTLIKNHPDCNAYMDYLVDNNFVHNLENLPSGLRPCNGSNYIDFIFNNLCVEKISVHDEHDVLTDMAVLVNMDCTRIELLINADGSELRPIERNVARKALAKYLELLNLSKSKDYVVFHLGEVLGDAYQDDGEEHKLPSGVNYKVVNTPFHGDIISNILNNISIRRHDKKIEQVITEALGISREQANFVHAFYACSTFCRHSTHFDYRDKHWTLFLTTDANGGQTIEVAPLDSDIRVKIADIHDLKSVIDQKFFNNESEPEEAPKEEPEAKPVEAPKEEPEAEPDEAPKVEADILVSIKVNTYINAYTKKTNDIISRTENGEDWFAKFKEVATPEEIVGYYFNTYGILKALYWWKKDFEKSERTESDVSVDRIFDSIFCPFCKQGKPVKFDSSNDMYLKRCDLHDNKVDCYAQGDSYVGTMVFPNCPLCGDKLEKK